MPDPMPAPVPANPAPGNVTVQNLITPNDQLIRAVFSTQRSYFIDIYQRDYKWTPIQVKTLLNDLEVRFGLGRRIRTNPHEIRQDVLEHFDPYFLNTYLSHTSPQATSIVDGQQRLTTLLLMLIKLYRIFQVVGTVPECVGRTFTAESLRPLIFEQDDFGTATHFKIFNPNREAPLRALVEGTEFEPADETQLRLKANFATISEYFEAFFRSESDPSGFDLIKLTYYTTYLLDRVSIVEIRIDRVDNVAMIFEVVNDRGLGLKPYEILKGKFLGSLPPAEKERGNQIWVGLQDLYYQTELKNTTEAKIDLDDFFRAYFRSKFAATQDDYKSFESDYHYEIYRRADLRAHFGDFQDPVVMFNRIVNEIHYFATLYQELRSTYNEDRPHLLYNKLVDQNQQYLLIMSAIRFNDPEREDKIRTISAKFDQLHVVLRVLGEYDSNTFQTLVYDLNVKLRNRTSAECRLAFDQTLIAYLKGRDRLEEGFLGTVSDLFIYERFKSARNTSSGFSKYLLLRIDRWLGGLLDMPSYCIEGLGMLEDRFNRTNRKRYALHLEHIYANNDQNRALFTDPATGLFDETTFDQTRNLMGVLLLLTDLQNISSGNDLYRDKIEYYRDCGMVWNQLLIGHIPGPYMPRLPEQFRVPAVEPDPTGAFPKEMVESRQRLFFEAFKQIWATV